MAHASRLHPLPPAGLAPQFDEGGQNVRFRAARNDYQRIFMPHELELNVLKLGPVLLPVAVEGEFIFAFAKQPHHGVGGRPKRVRPPLVRAAPPGVVDHEHIRAGRAADPINPANPQANILRLVLVAPQKAARDRIDNDEVDDFIVDVDVFEE